MIAIWHYPRTPRASGEYHLASDAEGKAAFVLALDRASNKPGRSVSLRLDAVDTTKHHAGSEPILFAEVCFEYCHTGQHPIEAEEVSKDRVLIKVTAVGRTHLQEAVETFNDMCLDVHRVGEKLSSRQRKGSIWFW